MINEEIFTFKEILEIVYRFNQYSKEQLQHVIEHHTKTMKRNGVFVELARKELLDREMIEKEEKEVIREKDD